LVLDEPTSGLDPFTRAEVVGRIKAASANRDLAMVVISHDLPDASHLASRTMVLYAGQAIELGSSPRVRGTPAHPYSWAWSTPSRS